MCKPASFVVTKDKVFWSKVSDSHEDIIKEFSLATEVAGKICIVRCEVTPPKEGRFDLPSENWIYKTDQEGGYLPEWFDSEEVEERCRLALNEWISERVVAVGRVIQNLEIGLSVFVCGGTVNAVRGGTVNAVWGGTVNEVWGGTVNDVMGGTVNAVRGGTVNAVWGGTVNAVWDGTVNAVMGGTVNAVWGGTVNAVWVGTVNAVWGGTVNAVRGGTVNAVWGGTVNEVWGGTVNEVWGGTVQFYVSYSCKLTGFLAVVINRVGKKAKCYIGTEKTRTVSGK